MAKDYIRKKPIISGTVSPTHKKKIDQLVEKGEFASVSDFISQAVSDFLKKYETSMTEGQQNSLTKSDLALIRDLIREEIEEMDFDRQK